jgi:Ca2+-transporting ATPase
MGERLNMWYMGHAEDVLGELGGDLSSGLSENECRLRLGTYGLNRLTGRKKKSTLRLFLEQLNSMLIFILIAAAAVSSLLGETTDTIIILAVIVLNAVIGVIQETRAEKALEALQNLSTPKALVIRGGVQQEIPSEQVVPGDTVVLDTGRIVPCDVRLVQSSNLRIEESALTGESVAAEKDASYVTEIENTPIGDRRNMAHMSTVVTYGRGVGVAVATGMDTEMGKIATMLEEERRELTPLQLKLELLGKRLGGIILALCALLFMVSLIRPLISHGGIEKSHLIELLLTAISLAVAAIPEGLPAIVTIVLALGVQRMVKRNAIIRSLPAVETLGSVNVICSDKTGTLTMNKMTVKRFLADGETKDIELLNVNNESHSTLMKCLVLCNDASFSSEVRTGDPTEIALLEAGDGKGMIKKDLERAFPRVGEIPFDSERKLMSTVHRSGERYMVMTKGALEQLLARCSSCLQRGQEIPLDDAKKDELSRSAGLMADDALRVLAAAYRMSDTIPDSAAVVEENLCFVGFVGMMDPPRLEVKDSIARCRESGIQTVMITGDHRTTALAIARALDIADSQSQVVSGEELDDLSDRELKQRAAAYRVYARVSPEHKMRIVKALRSRGNVVSMTGDGVNDAPSLQAADIGVAMGITGTDVAKGASDMVLTDDNYNTIVAAIEEGRNIYNNIRKSVLFLLSCNAGEIAAIFFAILFGWPTPLIPIHILWVNLITDTLPALSLGMDPGDPDVLDNPPRPPRESIFSGGGAARVIMGGLLIGALTLVAFRLGLRQHGGSLVHARTLAFAVLSLTQLFHAFNMRHVRKSLFGLGLFSNPFLIGALLLGAALQIGVITVAPLANLFRVVPLSVSDWLVVAVLSVIPIVCNEIVKIVVRRSVT